MLANIDKNKNEKGSFIVWLALENKQCKQIEKFSEKRKI